MLSCEIPKPFRSILDLKASIYIYNLQGAEEWLGKLVGLQLRNLQYLIGITKYEIHPVFQRFFLELQKRWMMFERDVSNTTQRPKIPCCSNFDCCWIGCIFFLKKKQAKVSPPSIVELING